MQHRLTNHSNGWLTAIYEIEALIEVLAEKGFICKEEVLEEIKKTRRK